MKALISASVASMIDQFNMNNIRILKDLGYDVHVACNFNNPGSITSEKCELLKKKLDDLDGKYYQVDFSRNVLSVTKHFKALKQLKKILKENNYKIVHCHSPIGGMLTRLAGKKYRKKGMVMIYTAHGFHFYRGAPKKNWILFYPIEKICSRWTDLLITINTEDYELAKNKMKANSIDYIPGVGVDVSKFRNTVIDKKSKKLEIGVPQNAFMLLSVGELNSNKNHQLVIKAISLLKNNNIHYVIAGIGDQKQYLLHLSRELNVNLHLLGLRSDVAELYKCADMFILPSIREGLNVSLMEAMSAGCPCIVSAIRGNLDMVDRSNCFNPKDEKEVAKLITKENVVNTDFVDKIDVSIINEHMRNIYKKIGEHNVD